MLSFMCGEGFSGNWTKGRFSNASKKLTKEQAVHLGQFGNDLIKKILLPRLGHQFGLVIMV